MANAWGRSWGAAFGVAFGVALGSTAPSGVPIHNADGAAGGNSLHNAKQQRKALQDAPARYLKRKDRDQLDTTKQAQAESVAQQAARAAIDVAIARADALIAARRDYWVVDVFARQSAPPPEPVTDLPLPATKQPATSAIDNALVVAAMDVLTESIDAAAQARRRDDEEALMMILMELA